MADRDLKLNSLARYAKSSPDLVLEEWSHCEIPAGCGGAVLRWWNPKRDVPIAIWVSSTGRLDSWLDGRLLVYPVPLVPFGTHVLSFSITQVASRQILLAAAVSARSGTNPGPTSLSSEQRTVAASAPDGSWKFTRVAPVGEDWTGAGFDDSGWQAMEAARDQTAAALSSTGIDRLARFGAQTLAVGETVTAVWVRRVFVLTGAVGPESPERHS
jgi:hypothetical protein